MIKWAFKVYKDGELEIETPQLESARRVYFNCKAAGHKVRLHLAIVHTKDGFPTEALEDCLESNERVG
jgi:hypothetical protein